MKSQPSTFSLYSFLVTIVSLLVACGITSRYRLDLFVASEDARKKVDVEQTEFVRDAALGDPFGDYKYLEGDASVAVITVTTRWDRLETERFRLLGFDEYWRCRLFLELPQPLQEGQIVLEGSSFLQLMGRYDVEAGDKIFLPVEGSCAIDSVTSKNVFFSIEGKYANRKEEPLEFSGQFKVKNAE
ncbi:MAG: hypothetical protein JSU74_03780 [Candidatus Zixiibacteriota bacterium]|nr:MAG: hypothetical protein JSU74_03780 [candidate division Zixibacteria bacterium]